jgi:hypothetical protein
MNIDTFTISYWLSRTAAVLSVVAALSLGNSIWTMTTSEWFFVVSCVSGAIGRYLVGLTHSG